MAARATSGGGLDCGSAEARTTLLHPLAETFRKMRSSTALDSKDAPFHAKMRWQGILIKYPPRGQQTWKNCSSGPKSRCRLGRALHARGIKRGDVNYYQRPLRPLKSRLGRQTSRHNKTTTRKQCGSVRAVAAKQSIQRWLD